MSILLADPDIAHNVLGQVAVLKARGLSRSFSCRIHTSGRFLKTTVLLDKNIVLTFNYKVIEKSPTHFIRLSLMKTARITTEPVLTKRQRATSILFGQVSHSD